MQQTFSRTNVLCLLLICFTNFGFSQNQERTKLPDYLYGEWSNLSGDRRSYNELLINPEFIEYGFRACKYQTVSKISSAVYEVKPEINGPDLQGTYNLEILSKDSIRLKFLNRPAIIYTKQENSQTGKYISIHEISEDLKKKWYATNNHNALTFNIENNSIWYAGKNYNIESVFYYGEGKFSTYRFLVKHGEDYDIFHLRVCNKDYIFLIRHVAGGGSYFKSHPDYPNELTDNPEAVVNSIVPTELRGNWLKADGSNLWSHSLYYNHAIIDKAIWNYKKVKHKGKRYVLTLEKNGAEKTIYAEMQPDGIVSFGTDKKNLITCSLTKINNPEFKSGVQETNISENILKQGIATYSGIIRNFDKSKGQTGTVSVNNVFTGKQDSYLININDDGSFSVSFPSYHLQMVYVSLPQYYNAIFIEPGKETWQLVHSGKKGEGFFMGDLAQLNTDFSSLSFLVFTREMASLQKQADQLNLNEYKEACHNVIENQKKQLDSVYKTQFLSETAYNLMKLKLDYRFYEVALSYDMFRNTPYNEASAMNKEYIDFITPEVLNNKQAILTSSYTTFINRLRFLRFLRKEMSVKHPDVEELGVILKAQGVLLTPAEEALLLEQINFKKDYASAIKKQEEFNNSNKDILRSYSMKLGAIYNKLSPEKRKEVFKTPLDFDIIQSFGKSEGVNVEFTEEEIAVQMASKDLLTEDERQKAKTFYTEARNKQNTDFLKKYKPYSDNYVQKEIRNQNLQNIKENFGSNFSADVMVAQVILGSLSRNYMPLSEEEITEAESFVEDSFIKTVFTIENEALKAKIEANKMKTDYVNNEVPNTEADKVFDAIISKYKGKVVFVDFWATWCGPCRSGMERIKPLKEELKDKDVVFVYITDPSSPKNTYNNMIPNIKGEHYRVSTDEWNYLKSKFNITGIPHYLLIDKEGNIVKRNTSDLRMPNTVKPLFEKYLK
ncbi:thioredoxin-like domain-containing protein [Aestuariibaculum sediminum]|uniref:Redoxin family protein n=1 Tax=Aestuariibaculum sediminum TaxID=2770637 RepID=A0A8J6UCI9_9FLAO|nr:redoxin family protein [Aestuariibaculum sediminum]MBD0832394.1 redoxin family protein [Aestuariibaculum sediminum]